MTVHWHAGAPVAGASGRTGRDVADPLVEAIKRRIPDVTVGETVLVDGREAEQGDGFFLRPSLIDDVRPGTAAYDDEIFGPVLGVTRVDSYDTAVAPRHDDRAQPAAIR